MHPIREIRIQLIVQEIFEFYLLDFSFQNHQNNLGLGFLDHLLQPEQTTLLFAVVRKSWSAFIEKSEHLLHRNLYVVDEKQKLLMKKADPGGC